VRHRKGERAREGAQALAASLRKLLPQRGVVITGPKQCGVEKIRGLFRWEILLTVVAGKEGAWVQKLLYPRMESFCRGARAEVLADVDPMSLM